MEFRALVCRARWGAGLNYPKGTPKTCLFELLKVAYEEIIRRHLKKVMWAFIFFNRGLHPFMKIVEAITHTHMHT